MRTLLAFILVGTLGAFAPAADAPKARGPALPEGVTRGITVEGLTEYKLNNGLRILLLPDASQPKVTVNCTIFVGSRHEGYGETGMAHLLEHMVFKGCPKFPDVPKALRDHGANFNGTTSLDRTNYYETMPANDENLEFGIELEADRLVNSFIAREELLKEFTVVRNEFEAGENSPENILSQRMIATAFEWHNYGKSTIGNRTDIERVPIDSLKAFYKKYYRPDNAMLFIAGSFDQAKALTLIAKYFGGIKNPADPLPVTYTEEPPQDGERLVTLRRVGKVGATGVVYHIPAATHPDYAAVEILTNVLADEPGGRAYQSLVEAKLASSVSGSSYALHDPGILEIVAQTEPAKTEDARVALVDTLENLTKKPVTAEEVERARRQLLKARERLLANSQRFAINLSEWAACGDWRLFFLHRDRIEKVTPTDVNRVASEYLVRSNRTVGVYIPTAKPERAAVPAAPSASTLVEGYKGRTAVVAGEAFDPTPENVEQRVKRGVVGEGIQFAVLAKKTRGETVNLRLNLRVGNEDSLKGRNAPFDFLGPLMLRGTKDKTRQQIQDDFDKLNATVSISTDGDRNIGVIEVGVQTKRANLSAVLALLGEVLRQPSFPQAEFDILKRESIDQLEKQKTEPQLLAVNALQRKMSQYPKDDVRYVPTLDEATVRLKAATREDVISLYDQQVGSGAGELSIVGDFEPDEALKVVDGILKGWTAKTPYKRIEKAVKPVNGSVEKINTPDKANAIYLAGTTFDLTDTDPEYAPLVVGNYMLGAAPLASRLSNRVRGKEGLSYGVGSQVGVPSLDKAGRFLIFAITNPKNIDKVDEAVGEEIEKFLKEGVSASELEETKKAYLATQRQQRANDTTLASQLAASLYAKRTFQYYASLEKQIELLQPGDVKGAFDKLISRKRLVIVEAGDFQKKPDEKKPNEKKPDEKKK
ncbi:M16 family metallopeptidase [Fimbriiglobus ruber]|uniref:Zinc protease n=1 Tax=Fimbriiglobus ruber TaxID=1908690 RepID=A0A225DK67_9BACT|nr:pitrilysin family protein [Fimbriiglobus ruber]OWK37589.1 Zinc protease [Fimbriiglobus ruber]